MILSPEDAAERALEFLQSAEPATARELQSAWREMAASDVQVSSMALTGSIPLEYQLALNQAYARFTIEVLAPRMEAALQAGASTIASTLSEEARRRVALGRALNIRANLQRQQQQALQIVLQRPLPPRQLAAIIKPIVAATPQTANRILALRDSLEASGVPESQIESKLGRALNNAASARANTIARTETAATLNAGTQLAIEHAVDDGDVEGEIFKQWRTQQDERTCPICGPLHDVKVPFNEPFSIGALPPAHPNCRCVVLYIEEET